MGFILMSSRYGVKKVTKRHVVHIGQYSIVRSIPSLDDIDESDKNKLHTENCFLAFF